ncbi:DUF1080 domain-containing protein [Aquiflexum sp. TKW24L]|uniref:3-keto-disaccharide hydrolase n=1 Tax=Aquiflexum sp. TKW24L TaxID=2942212 RepID=UPI0020BEC586|nr:DUF1080 domain-containing protein [Aquiflexum sp. TKW24L]MCL6259892.1 DUF1080 domain-containing protein [Aquiflexum sp. TKW24L]
MIRLINFLAFCMITFTIFSCAGSQKNESEAESWQTLFNGIDLNGWVPKIHKHEVGENFAETFRVVDGAIQVNYDQYEVFEEKYGHLFYKEPFSSFHLKWEYRFTDQWMSDAPDFTYRNSGVMFHSQDPNTILKEQDWPVSVEYQMLADAGDGNPRPTGNMCSPGTQVYFEGVSDPRHCINSTSETFPWDAWVKAELIVYEDSLVMHLVNGDTVLRYTKPHQKLSSGVVNRFTDELFEEDRPLKSGYIGLQAEGQGVEFKEIKIKKLD